MWKTVVVPQKLNIELLILYDPEILFLVYTQRIESRDDMNRYFYTHIHSSFSLNSQKVETTHTSINKQINAYKKCSIY